MTDYFDSHCHLTDERLRERVGEVLAAAESAGVMRIVTIASEPEDARAALDIARRHGTVHCTAGIHPHEADHADEAAFETIAELTRDEKVVAVGETGLDYHYDNAPRERQRTSLDRHARIAQDSDLPLVIHARDADDDMIAFLRAAGAGVRGVLHCFAGGRALLDAGLEAGWTVSFAGLVSFRNYDGADLVRAVPLERLLIETDSPYLAPVPVRGRTNEPAHVVHVAEAVARLRDVSVDVVAAATYANACAFYRIEA